MTTTWKPEPLWSGETVAVLASGPSMGPRVAQQFRGKRSIAVNHTAKLVPWTDMVVALDMTPDLVRQLLRRRALRVTGQERADVDALYIGPMWERVDVAPGHQVEFRDSGLAAVRIAAAMGAARIVLAGFDPESPGVWYSGQPRRPAHPGYAAGLAAIETELIARGIAVERFAMPTGSGNV